MKLRCPACGADFNLEEAVRGQVMEELVRVAANFGMDWPLVSEYLDLFRLRRDGALAVKKRLRLLKEVWGMWQTGKFCIGGQWYTVGRQEFRGALAEVNNRELLGLKNHNYLKQVLRAAAQRTAVRLEKELREKESRLQAGLREPEAPPEEEGPPDPEWEAVFRRLLKESTRAGLTPEQRAEIQARTRAHLAKRRRDDGWK